MSTGLKIIFAGTPEFAVPALQALLTSQHEVIAVYTQPDRPAGRGRKLRLSPIKEIALQAEIPVYQPNNLNADECKHLHELGADVMLVSAYGLLLPTAALRAPKLGCINIHASLLPKWRGAAPIQRAIIAGDKQTGITIMQMVEALDAGPILCQFTCTIGSTDTGSSLHDRLAQMSAREIDTSLQRLQRNEYTPRLQDTNQVSYANKLSKQEAKINWQESARDIERKIRAFNAWPVAYSYLLGQRIRIWEAVSNNASSQQKPGTVITASKEGIEVATGEDVLRLLSLQLSGGKIISAQDFVNAHDVLHQCFSDEHEISIAAVH